MGGGSAQRRTTMGWLKPIALGITLATAIGCAAVRLPSIDPATLIGDIVLSCPDGPIDVRFYDDGQFIVTTWSTSLGFVLWVKTDKTTKAMMNVIVERDGRLEQLTHDELTTRFPSPCQLPRSA